MYVISAKTYRNALKVLRDRTLYSTKTCDEAEQIVENHDSGASFDRKPAEFNPKRKKRK